MTEIKTDSPVDATETPQCQWEGESHRPDDLPDEGNRCKYCGRPITWIGGDDWEVNDDAELPEPIDRFPARRADATSVKELYASAFEGNGDMRYGDSPEENVHDNTRRAGFVIPALHAYAKETRTYDEDFETVISDLLGDMRHLCDALGVDFDAASERGGGHYEAEVTGNWA